MDINTNAPVSTGRDLNQNEAASINQVKALGKHDKPPPVSDKPKANVETSKLFGKLGCPSIIITPPSPIHGLPDDELPLKGKNQSFPNVTTRCNKLNTSCPESIATKSAQNSDGNNLQIPHKETTKEILRPREKADDASNCSMANKYRPNNDVKCQRSSTPNKSPINVKRDNSKEDPNMSPPTLEPPSPIAKSDIKDSTLTDSCMSQSMNASNDTFAVSNNISLTPTPREDHSYTKNTAFIATPDKSQHDGQGQFTDTPHPRMVDMNLCTNQRQLTTNPESQYEGQSNSTGAQNQQQQQQQQPSPQVSYTDYSLSSYPSSENSWTDMSFRSDEPPPYLSDNFQPHMSGTSLQQNSHGLPDGSECFVYPSIYVSNAGLISVLLKNDMSVEMTIDRTIRVVSHHHMMAVATDSRGTSASLYHPAAKVFQVGTTTDIATDTFRARMGSEDAIVFSNSHQYFRLEDCDLQPIAPIKFSDISRDQSVNLLFSSEGYGEPLVSSSMQVAAQAEYSNLPKGGVIVRINGVKVTQTGNGDVSVVTGAKFLRLSPHFGTARLGNRYVDIEIEKDWTVKLTRGSHSFVSSRNKAMISNGKMEAGFDENNSLKVASLVPKHPLLAGASFMKRRDAMPSGPRKPVKFFAPTPFRRKQGSPQWGGRGRMF